MKKASIINLLFLLAIVAFSQNLSPQNHQITGRILDLKTKKPLIGASVKVLTNSKNTETKKLVATNTDGYFFITDLNSGNYVIMANYIGYTNSVVKLPITAKTATSINLGNISLSENEYTLNEAEVVGRLPEVVVKQDTLEYNPAAYKLQPGSVVEDMLKRMSGVEIDTEGKIKVAGKEVKKVYVDGKEFFANDPTVATKNFTTDMIERIQVIDKKSDLTLLTGIDDGEEETVINLTIKKGMKKGWMSNIQAGAGREITPNAQNGVRYESNALVNRFFGDSQLSVIANGNNTNNQGSRDFGSGFNSQMGMRGGRSGGGNNSGITTSNLLGVNGAFALSNQFKIGGNVMFNHFDNFAKQESRRENLLQDSVSYNNSKTTNQYNSDNFSTSLKLEYRPDSSWTFIFTPTFSVNKSTTSTTDSTTLLAGTARDSINSSGKYSYNKSNGYSVNGRFDISYQFKTKGRRWSLSLESGRNESDGFGTIYANTTYYRNGLQPKLQDQNILNNSDNNTYRLYSTYIEPIGKNNFLQFSYSLKNNDSHSDKYSYNYSKMDSAYSLLDMTYSKSFDNTFINQQIGTSLKVVREKYGYTIGIELSPSITQSRKYLIDSTIMNIPSRFVMNYAPNLEYTYRFDRSHNLRIDYRGQSKQPSITQLDPSRSQSSATSITVGNPSLLPTFNNNLTIRYTSNNKETQRSLMTTIQSQYVMNSIINRTSYDANGNRLTEYVNENGEWNTSMALMLNTPIGKSKFQINTYSTASYNNQIGFTAVKNSTSPTKEITPSKNTSNTLGLNENLGVIFRNDWLYTQLRGNVRYAKSENSIASLQSNETMTNSISLNAQVSLPIGFTLSSDVRYSENKGFTAGFSKNETIWNAELSKTLFQKNQGTIRLKIYDILRQQLNYNWVSNAQYIQDTQYNTLTSYFMVYFNYRFNSMGKSRGSGDGEGHRHERGERGERNERGGMREERGF
jgi:hypothetical protein